MNDPRNELRPRKGKGGRWFLGPSNDLSFATREEAMAHIEKKDSSPSLGRYGLIAITLLAVGLIGYVLFGRDREPAACGGETMAYVMSQKAVTSDLRSPGSAQFPTIPDAKSVRIGECKFRIESYVDAQNGFGAMVRSYYTAEMEYFPGEKKWRAIQVNMGK